MNRLIIIGNGFDLAHGLPTSYEHFLCDYLKNCLLSANKNSHYEDDQLKISFKSSQRFDTGAIQAINKINDVSEFIKECKDLIVTKYTNKFLERTIDISDGLENWKNIEYFYFSCLKEIVQTSIQKGFPEIAKIRSLNTDLDQIKNLLVEYLIKEVKPIIDGLDVRRVIDSGFYEIFQSKIMDSDNNVIVGPSETLILNFNYTLTIGRYPNETFYNSTGVRKAWIHGSINGLNNPVIFGYGDEKNDVYADMENLNRNEFLENIKYFSYLRTPIYKKLISFIEQETYEALVLGHSCGLSDRTLLSRIFENKNCQKIQVYHFGGFEGYKTTAQEISRHMENKSDFLRKVADFDNNYEMPSNI